MDYRVETIGRKWAIFCVVQLRVIRGHARIQGKMRFDKVGEPGVAFDRLQLRPGDLVEYSDVGTSPCMVGDLLNAGDPALEDKLFRKCDTGEVGSARG